MKPEIKALIVFLILVLSAGPMIYFFGVGGEEEPPVIPDEELPYTVLGITMIGEITNLEEYIIYNGDSSYNNLPYPIKVLNETLGLKDYKATSELSRTGEGYSYHIKIPINPKRNLEELGFNLAYELQPFFTLTPGMLPIRMGRVNLPEKINLNLEEENKNITVELGNLSSKLVALYWQKEGDIIQIHCPKMRFDKETLEFLKNEDLCYDITQTESFGLKSTVLDSLKEKETLMDLSVELIKGVYYETEDKEDVSTNDIFEELSEWYSTKSMTVRKEDGKIKIDLAYINENASVGYVYEKLDGLGLEITDEFKEAVVVLPNFIKIDGVEYKMQFTGAMRRAKIKTDTLLLDVKKFRVFTKAKYDQLLEMRIVEIGLDTTPLEGE